MQTFENLKKKKFNHSYSYYYNLKELSHKMHKDFDIQFDLNCFSNAINSSEFINLNGFSLGIC